MFQTTNQSRLFILYGSLSGRFFGLPLHQALARRLRDVGTLGLTFLQIPHIQPKQGGIVDLLLGEFRVTHGLVT